MNKNTQKTEENVFVKNIKITQLAAIFLKELKKSSPDFQKFIWEKLQIPSNNVSVTLNKFLLLTDGMQWGLIALLQEQTASKKDFEIITTNGKMEIKRNIPMYDC